MKRLVKNSPFRIRPFYGNKFKSDLPSLIKKQFNKKATMQPLSVIKRHFNDQTSGTDNRSLLSALGSTKINALDLAALGSLAHTYKSDKDEAAVRASNLILSIQDSNLANVTSLLKNCKFSEYELKQARIVAQYTLKQVDCRLANLSWWSNNQWTINKLNNRRINIECICDLLTVK